ncbi:hypothetical protein IU500_17485 [Nocardia terpenica]|uniref:hypothetical protein n=1 Tax=Nocardia terpenica TaxID=455432 RepID=UPI0018956A55|nr:hypothetical protein [Nocardia terpenica]MBF6063278.1 hypothetical protein [Nocardia terpenica]MBF6105834.1 hypothetical protein [Nocardia terpenica]MBF6113582.1 hypothetical protein [Nocardia terpenica]MBF6119575.1 hypothetical protein [Nocardia terpenica]MBF6151986.1 hypothetical protein [Nocardia terpenica]
MAVAEGSAASTYPARPATVRDFRGVTDGMWAAATGPRTSKKPTKRRMAAAVESALADVIDWLAKHPEDCTSVKALAEALSGEVVDKLTAELEPAGRLARRQQVAHHFWCSLLAAFAQTMKAVDQVPDAVVKILLQHKESSAWAGIPDAAIKVAVHAAWRAIKNLPVLGGYDHLLRTVRILAVAICPAPESHKEVFEYCVKPMYGALLTPIVQDETVRRLERALPPGWI